MQNTQISRSTQTYEVQTCTKNNDNRSDGTKPFQTAHIAKPSNWIRTTRLDWTIENFLAVIATEKGSITSQSWELSDRTLQEPLRFRLRVLAHFGGSEQ